MVEKELALFEHFIRGIGDIEADKKQLALDICAECGICINCMTGYPQI